MKQNIKIEFLNCDQEGHKYEQLNVLCIDSKCKNQGLHCIQCFIEQNHSHQPESLVKYLQNFKKSYKQNLQDRKENTENTLQIDQIHQRLKSQIYELELSIQQIFKNIQNQVQAYLDIVQEKQNRINGFGTSIDSYIENILSPQKAQKGVVETKILVKEFLNLASQIDINGIDTIDKLVQANNNFIKDYQQKTLDVKDKIIQLLDPLYEIDIDSYLNSFQFCLDKLIPVNNFQFSDNTITRIYNTGYNDCFAILKPQLYSSQKITFKNVKGYWIAIGICFRNILEKNKFEWMYTEKYHGTYLLSQNGYLWSNHDSGKNQKPEGFPFTPNDIIEVSYVKNQNLITFVNQTQNKSCLLSIQSKAEDQVHFCVILHNKGDKIQFV